MKISCDIAKLQVFNSGEGLWLEDLERFAAKVDTHLLDGLVVDKVSKLLLMRVKVYLSLLVESAEELLSLFPAKQITQHSDDAHLAV